VGENVRRGAIDGGMEELCFGIASVCIGPKKSIFVPKGVLPQQVGDWQSKVYLVRSGWGRANFIGMKGKWHGEK